jgi:hypothetical protein
MTKLELRLFNCTGLTTMAEISISIENKYFGGEHNIIETFNIIRKYTMYQLMYLYVFKVTVAIAFLCTKAVEAIQISFISVHLPLWCDALKD